MIAYSAAVNNKNVADLKICSKALRVVMVLPCNCNFCTVSFKLGKLIYQLCQMLSWLYVMHLLLVAQLVLRRLNFRSGLEKSQTFFQRFISFHTCGALSF